ncbi:MAG: ATP-binding protein [Candidatus Dormiibacterota bacterium]
MVAFLRRTRVRLTLAYTVGAAVVLSAGGVAFWLVFSDLSLAAIDNSLRGEAQILAAGLHASGESVLFNGSSTLPSRAPDGSSIGALVVASDGRVVDQAGQAVRARTVLATLRAIPKAGTAPVLDTVVAGGMSQRALVQRIDVGGGQTDVLVLNRPLDEYQQSLHLAAALLGVTGLVLAVGSALSAYWLAGRVLRPVRIITVTARDLSEHSLDRRLNLNLPDDELGSLAQTFNQMLDRLEASFSALQRFTADAAHELRGPLTALRSEVEVVLRRPRGPEAYRDSLGIVLAETERLSRVTDQLLLLARADVGTLEPACRTIDAFDLLEETAERWRPLAAGTSVTVAVHLPQEGTVWGDPDLLRRLLNNLIENAIRHTPPGGTVTLSCQLGRTQWRLGVQDTGAGVDPALRPILFLPFTGADPGRSREGGGAGLGLALAAAITRAHGGTISLEEGPPQGAHFVVELPCGPA